MPTCSAFGCSYKSCRNKIPGKTIHRFPFSRPDILKQWITNMWRKDWKPSHGSILCSDHFEHECFDRTGKIVRLRHDAVPTIFNFPQYLQTVEKERTLPNTVLLAQSDPLASTSADVDAMLESDVEPSYSDDESVESEQDDMFQVTAMQENYVHQNDVGSRKFEIIEQDNLFQITETQENYDDQNDIDDPSIESEQDNSFHCTVCFEDFPTLINLQRHYIKHITNKPYQCQKCKKGFFTKSALVKHSDVHNNDHLYPCDLCHDSFATKSKFEAHLETHSFPEFICNACFKHFPKKHLLQQHERAHTLLQEDSLSYGCILCDIQFVNQRDLEDHMDEHEKVNLYTCKECDKTFFYNYILQRHTQRHSFQVQCNVCRESFTDKMRLHEHEQLHLRVELDGNNILRFTCDLCNAMFPFKTELETHYNDNHEGHVRFPCAMCFKSYFFSYQCSKHKFTHTEFNDFQCDQCPKKFKTSVHLSTHIKVMHCEKETQCSLCRKVFSTKWHLKKHSRVHTNEKPFMCEFCGAAFKRKPNLLRHYMTHTNEKQYKCDKCNLTFTRSTGLKQHMKRHIQNPIVCNKCSQYFTSKSALLQHRRKEHRYVSPENQKLYPCKVCGKVLRHYSSHIIHARQHTGERPFKCKYCGRTFVQRQHLLLHHKFHHSELDLVVELPFKCAHCKHSCLLENGLKRHHTRYHPKLEFMVQIM